MLKRWEHWVERGRPGWRQGVATLAWMALCSLGLLAFAGAWMAVADWLGRR